MKGTTSKARIVLLAAVAMGAALQPRSAHAQAQTCNGLTTIDYVSGPNFAVPGDVLRVRITLGTGSINGGTQLTIQRLKFELDCNSNFALGLPCTDEGAMVEYEGDGTITDTCGKVWTTGHPVSSAPNSVVFTPNTPVVIPANQAVPPGFCNVEFDVKVLAAPSIDVTPAFIEEVGGYTNLDAACNNGVLASGGSQSSAIPLCPVCTGDQCNDSACNQTTGQCVVTPKPDSTPCGDTDQNACTTAGCEQGACVQTHQQTICTPDTNECTSDPACNPATGLCTHPPVPDSTPCTDTDQNLCTTAGCEQGQCVQPHQQTVCTPDTNECTNDPACNPATGLCTHPPVPDSTPCGDTDSNLCTTAGCEQGQCVQTHQQTVCTPDTNECTLDPPCNPGTGQCTHPPSPDSTPCTDTDQNLCTVAGCEMGQCVQAHISDICQVPDHFSCYEVKPFLFHRIPGVSLVDQFGPSTVNVDRPNKLCAPADKNDEQPEAPNDPDHLTAFRIRNPAIKRLNQVVVNQFGTITLDVIKTDFLFVPTAKSLVAPAPAPPVDPAVDHFQCYKVRRSKGAPPFQKILGVKVDDQFGTGTVDLLKPAQLCAPVNKNNEDPTAPQHPDHLLCYKVKGRAPFSTKQVWLGNQFGPFNGLILTRRQGFCVPSLKNPSSTTTTSTPATTTTSSTAVQTTTTSTSTSTSTSSSTTTTSTSTTTSTTQFGSPSAAFLDHDPLATD